MAPVPLLLFRGSEFIPFHAVPSRRTPARLSSKASLNSQQQQQQPATPSSSPSFRSSSELSGKGAAAPSRGELFLERQHSHSAASRILKQGKAKSGKKKEAGHGGKPSHASPCCYGCGGQLQTAQSEAPGYVDPEVYELKKKHHQLRTVLCGRCKLLAHGHMVTAVGGHGGYPGGKHFVTAEELRERLSYLRHEKVLIVKLVDIIDFNGSLLAHIRDLVGANPIILVVTKVDLLPRGTELNCVGDWVVETITKKKINVISVHLTSSKSSVGIVGVIAAIKKEKKVQERQEKKTIKTSRSNY